MVTHSDWNIVYWVRSNDEGAVEEWLDSLDEDQFKSVAKELKMLEICGNTLRLPHSRSLGEGLFELRERKYGLRIYYGYQQQRVIILLAAGNKKTQERDIRIARQRLESA